MFLIGQLIRQCQAYMQLAIRKYIESYRNLQDWQLERKCAQIDSG